MLTMDFLLYHKKTSPTGKLLAKELGIPSGSTLPDSQIQIETLIRWGCQADKSIRLLPRNTINSVRGLSLASNKLSTLRQLQEAGLSVPAFSTELSKMNLPCLGRMKHGFKGKDLLVIESQASREPTAVASTGTSQPHDFYTEYVPNTREYRIHVFKGTVIRVQGKYLDIPEQWTNKYVKNYDQGYRFRAPDKTLNKDRLDAAIKAVEVLGLDFGAVDLLIGNDKKYYLLEVNTAPACSPLTLSAYVNALKPLLAGTDNEYARRVVRRPVSPPKAKRRLGSRKMRTVK